MQTNSEEKSNDENSSTEKSLLESETSLSQKRPSSPAETNEQSETKKQQIINPPPSSSTTQAPNQPKPDEFSIVDIAQALSLEPGSRIEVQWDLHFDTDVVDDTEDQIDQKEAADAQIDTKQTRWWGGTLLHADTRVHTLQDGRDELTVPIRVIDYDPYIEGGFPDRSLEDVCFLTDHSLLNIASDSRSYWRKEGDTWEPNTDMDEEERTIMTEGADAGDDDDISVSSTSKEDALRAVLDAVLQSAMQKAGIMSKMMKLEASQRSIMAEKIAKAKKKLTDKLLELSGDGDANGNGEGLETVITKDHIKKCMEELQNDL
jgi:hypothetical protein